MRERGIERGRGSGRRGRGSKRDGRFDVVVRLAGATCVERERAGEGEGEGVGGTNDLTSSSGSQALPSSLSVPLITAAGFRDFLPAVSIALPVTCV